MKAAVFKIHLHFKDLHVKRMLLWHCLLGMCSLRFSYTGTQRRVQSYAKKSQLYLVLTAELGIVYVVSVLEGYKKEELRISEVCTRLSKKSFRVNVCIVGSDFLYEPLIMCV